MKQLSLILLLPSLCSTSFADVNARDGDFSKTFQDFGMDRTYHSRSLQIGAFGFGWCSDWDTTLDIKTEKMGSLSDCKSTTSTPIALIKQGKFWIVSKNKSQLFFTHNGSLFKVINAQGTEVQAERDSKTNFIHLIKSSKGERIHFQYENQDLKLKNSNQGVREKYSYDELHNLTEVYEWKKSQWQITDQLTYDTGRDLTLGHLTSQGCEDSFTYLRETKLAASTLVQRTCPGKSIQVLKYQFTYQTHLDGTISLDRMSVVSGSRTTQLSFHSRTGELQPSTRFDGGLR